MFSNAKSVEINGKEVQSIVLENGGVLYEKLGNTNLELTYSPSTVYNGDTVTLTTILTNGDISNKEISLLASEPCFDKYFPPLGLSVGEEFCIKQYQGDIVWARSNRAILEDKLMVRDTSVQYTPITYPIYIKKIDSSPTYEFYHSPNGQKTLILTDTIDNEEFTLSGSILGQSNYTNISTNSNGIASTNIICDNFSSVNITASYNDLSDNVNIIVNDKYNLNLVSDKKILSAYDNDTATLTATLTENNVGISNEKIYIYSDSNRVTFKEINAWWGDYIYEDGIKIDLSGDCVINLSHGSSQLKLCDSDGNKLYEGTFSSNQWTFSITNNEFKSYDNNSTSPTRPTRTITIPTNDYSIELVLSNNEIKSDMIIESDDLFFKTLTTDSNGECSTIYNSHGVGDIIFTAKCMNLQETYSLEDCIIYDSLTSASGKWTVPSGVTSVYSDEGWKISANAYRQVKLTEKLTSACSVEFTVVDYSTPISPYASVIVYAYTNGETTPNQMIMMNYPSRIDVLGTSINHTVVKGAVYKIEYTASTIKVYENDTLLASDSSSVGFPTRFEWHMGANGRYAIYKDLKLKPL